MERTELQLLLIEDNPGDIRLCREILRESATTSWSIDQAGSLEEGKKKIREQDYDLIVLDLNLPDSEGLVTFKDIQASAQDTPVVILSGRNDHDLALEAMKSGAQDYLLKDEITPGLVVRSFQYAVERSQLIQKLSSQSFTDELSGLLNRRGFFTLGEQQVKLTRRSGNPMTMFFIDIDDMKTINDRHGHKKGDLAIEATAEVLKRTFRESDLVARLGGDEFAALAIDSPADYLEQISTRIQEQIGPVEKDFDLPFVLSLSMGTSVWNRPETQSLELLLQQADRAMYAQKARKDDIPAYAAVQPAPFREKPPFVLDELELLLVEDNPGDARLVEAYLAASSKVVYITHVDRLSKISSLYGNKDFSVILLDLSLPDSHGLDTVKAVLHLYPNTPVVVLTGQDDQEVALAAIQAGAQDYLVKGQFDENSLERSLQYAVERHGLQLQNMEYLDEIQQSEQTLQNIFDHVRIGIFQTDWEGNVSFANRVMVNLLKYDSLLELTGRNILKDNLGFGEADLARLKIEKVVKKVEVLDLIDKEGLATPVRLGLTLSEVEGRTTITGTVENISQQLESEQQISLQASALDAAANAIIITDSEGQTVWINQAFSDLTGYESAEILGQNPRILRSGQQDADFYSSMWKAISSGMVWQGEMVNKRKNGSIYKERMTITPLRNDQDQISHYIAIKEDITVYLESRDLLQRRLSEVNVLNSIAVAGIEETDEDQLITRITSIIGELFYNDHFGFLMLSKDGQDLVVHPSYQGVSEEWLNKSFPLEQGVVGRAAREKQPVIVEDVSQEEDYIGETPDMQSELAVPLIAEGQLWGVINAESRDAAKFTEDDARLMSTVAGQAGSAISKIRANQQEQEQRKVAEVLAGIALALNSSLDIETILDQILSEIYQMIPYKTASLFLQKNGEARVFRHRGYKEMDLEEWIEGFSMSMDNPDMVYFGDLFTRGEPLLVPDTALDQNWVVIPQTSWIRSYLGISIKRGNRILGIINIDHDQPNAFNESHIEIMEALSNQISTAIENAELYRQQTRQLEFLESLRQIDIAITGSLDLNVTLNVILSEIIPRLDIEAADILLYDADAFQIQTAVDLGFQSTAIHQFTLFKLEGLPGKIIQDRTAYSIPDLRIDDLPKTRMDLFNKENFIGYYGTPLISKGKVVGVLELFSRDILQIDSEWIRYAETVATQTAIAIDNSHLFSNLQKANLDLSLAYDTTLEGWAGALELRDHETEGHSRRVVDLTMDLVKEMKIPEGQWIHIRRGALLHDIGKMGVPDRILQKPGKLDEEEWILMRQHPLFADRWLQQISYLKPALDIPLYHHERWDGTGYPKGLKGTEIPLAARLFAVIDVWDALRSDRPYRKAWSKKKTLQHIQSESGKHFDPEVVKKFILLIESKTELGFDNLGNPEKKEDQ